MLTFSHNKIEQSSTKEHPQNETVYRTKRKNADQHLPNSKKVLKPRHHQIAYLAPQNCSTTTQYLDPLISIDTQLPKQLKIEHKYFPGCLQTHYQTQKKPQNLTSYNTFSNSSSISLSTLSYSHKNQEKFKNPYLKTHPQLTGHASKRRHLTHNSRGGSQPRTRPKRRHFAERISTSSALSPPSSRTPSSIHICSSFLCQIQI